MKKITPPEVRFWRFVDKSRDCWIWKGCTRNGYGAFGVTRSVVPVASRYAYEISVGPIPEGMLVCHTCDTPRCVNPAHLFLGTYTDNMRDCKYKGRIASGGKMTLVTRGEKNGNSRLSSSDVSQIRSDYAGPRRGPSLSMLASRYSVSTTHISRIVNRISWAHIA